LPRLNQLCFIERLRAALHLEALAFEERLRAGVDVLEEEYLNLVFWI
jgi:hypothetical protein